jgi:hypothetical protein
MDQGNKDISLGGNQCPICNKKPMTFFKKMFVSPSFKYQCKECGGDISVSKTGSLLMVFPFIFLGKIVDIIFDMSFLGWMAFGAVLLISYSAFIPFKEINE